MINAIISLFRGGPEPLPEAESVPGFGAALTAARDVQLSLQLNRSLGRAAAGEDLIGWSVFGDGPDGSLPTGTRDAGPDDDSEREDSDSMAGLWVGTLAAPSIRAAVIARSLTFPGMAALETAEDPDTAAAVESESIEELPTSPATDAVGQPTADIQTEAAWLEALADPFDVSGSSTVVVTESPTGDAGGEVAAAAVPAAASAVAADATAPEALATDAAIPASALPIPGPRTTATEDLEPLTRVTSKAVRAARARVMVRMIRASVTATANGRKTTPLPSWPRAWSVSAAVLARAAAAVAGETGLGTTAVSSDRPDAVEVAGAAGAAGGGEAAGVAAAGVVTDASGGPSARVEPRPADETEPARVNSESDAGSNRRPRLAAAATPGDGDRGTRRREGPRIPSSESSTTAETAAANGRSGTQSAPVAARPFRPAAAPVVGAGLKATPAVSSADTRVESIEELRDQASRQPLHRVSLRIGDGDSAARVRVDLRGDAVRSDVATDSVRLAGHLSRDLPELDQALRRQGLETDGLRVRTGDRVVAAAPAASRPEAGDRTGGESNGTNQRSGNRRSAQDGWNRSRNQQNEEGKE